MIDISYYIIVYRYTDSIEANIDIVKHTTTSACVLVLHSGGSSWHFNAGVILSVRVMSAI